MAKFVQAKFVQAKFVQANFAVTQSAAPYRARRRKILILEDR